MRHQQPAHVVCGPAVVGRVQTVREAEVSNGRLSGWNRVVPETFGVCDDEDPCRRGRGWRRGGDGVVGAWYGKAPGLDRSGDALKHAIAMGSGPNGGVVRFCGDDPSAKSSTLSRAV